MKPDSAPSNLSLQQIVARMDGRLQPAGAATAEAYLPSPMVQNHAAFLAFLPNGDLACTWFGGSMEGRADISIWMSRLALGGSEWSAAQQLTNAPDRSEQNPVLFTAPDGEVWLLHTSQPGGRQDECQIMARRSQDGGRRFGPPRCLGDFRGVFVRQPMQITASGRWLLPGFRCVTPAEGRWTGGLDMAVTLFSDDQGATWSATEVPQSLGAVHMNPLPPQDGVAPAFYRDRFSQYVKRSQSTDGGETWSPPVATNMPNNNSSVQAIRLADGRIAMVLNPINATMSDQRRFSLYDEIEVDAVAGTGGAIWGVPRAPLALALSSDNGKTFEISKVLDDGSGACLSNNSIDGLNRELSYPSILQDPCGDLHIAYTYHRRAIKYLRIPQP